MLSIRWKPESILKWTMLFGILCFFMACAMVQPSPGPVAPPESRKNAATSQPAIQSETAYPQTEAREMAAKNLLLRAASYLSAKRPDAAIEVLERALQIAPDNGETYFLLSQAWLQKGNQKQALEFNHLAGIHLQNDMDWVEKLSRQRAAITKE